VVFEPLLRQPPLTLSPRQIATVKRIVGRFEAGSRYRVERDILPSAEGFFVLGNVRFGWVPHMIYIHDPETKLYFVVDDPALAKMGEAFFKAEGAKPPLQYPSQDQWREILSVLE